MTADELSALTFVVVTNPNGTTFRFDRIGVHGGMNIQGRFKPDATSGPDAILFYRQQHGGWEWVARSSGDLLATAVAVGYGETAQEAWDGLRTDLTAVVNAARAKIHVFELLLREMTGEVVT